MGLRSNRLVGKPHQQLRELEIPDEGRVLHLKGYGWIKVFRFVATNGRTDYVGTSRTDLSREQVKEYFERRWSVEVLHQELKQTCGLARCQANSGRAQRNHIGLALLTWIRKHKRRLVEHTTLYQQDWEVIRPGIQLALAARLNV